MIVQITIGGPAIAVNLTVATSSMTMQPARSMNVAWRGKVNVSVFMNAQLSQACRPPQRVCFMPLSAASTVCKRKVVTGITRFGPVSETEERNL
jgi:hypothetical protein